MVDLVHVSVPVHPVLDHSGVILSTAVVASRWRRHEDYCSRLANTSALNSLIVKT